MVGLMRGIMTDKEMLEELIRRTEARIASGHCNIWDGRGLMRLKDAYAEFSCMLGVEKP